MTITIQLNKEEELKLLKPLLAMLREADVSIQVLPERSFKAASLDTQSNKSSGKISDKLHGILQLPAGFDYKAIIAEELQQKHSHLHG